MSPRRKTLLVPVLLWSVASIFGQLPSPSTSVQWKTFPLTGNDPGFDENSGGENGRGSERLAVEKVPGKPEGDFDRMTHDMTPTGVGLVENADKSEPPQTDERSESQTGKTHRRREKTSGRRWRQKGANMAGEREGTTRRAENGLIFRGKRVADDKKERRKWSVNTLSVWGKRNDEGNGEGDYDRIQADDTSNERRPEADGSKPEVATSAAANDRGRSRRKRRSVGDADEDSEPSVDWYPAAAVSCLSKRSKPRRRSVPAPYNGPKRTWETNTMKVWGKRNGVKPTWEEYVYSAEPIGGKRKWSSNNAFRIWGKRDAMPPPNDDEENFLSRLYDTFEN